MNHYFTHFDKLFREFENATLGNYDYYEVPKERKAESCSLHSYPHSNVWLSDDTNCLSMEFALAGYSEEEISVTANDGVLHIVVEPKEDEISALNVHHGISRKRVNFSLNIDKAFDAKKAKTYFTDGILLLEMKKGKEQEAIKLM